MKGIMIRGLLTILFLILMTVGLSGLAITNGIDTPLNFIGKTVPDEGAGAATALLVVLMALVFCISFVLAIFVPIDKKEVPIKMISRVLIQDLVIIVIDKTVFQKTEIEWANVALRNVKRYATRTFFYMGYSDIIKIKESSPDKNLIGRNIREDIQVRDELETLDADDFDVTELDDFKMGVQDHAEEKNKT